MHPKSRRTVLGAGLAVLAASIVGCTKALQSRPPTADAPPPTTESAAPAVTTDRQSTPPLPTAGPTTSTTRPAMTTTTAPTSNPTAVSASPATRSATRTSPSPPSSVPRPVSAAREVAHGPRNRPQVALTFHGAGDIAYARGVLAIAAEKKARITVMAVGTWLADNPGIGRDILSAGHDLGNHTLSHLDINSLAPQDIRREVVGCRDILLRTTGTPGSYFRQSQSQTASEEVKRIAGQAGYAVALSYDLDSMDWQDPGPEVVRHNLLAAGPGSIVSMHLGHPGTVQALGGILEDLKARGLSAVTVSRLLSA